MTHLSADLLFNTLLGLGQGGHGSHVRPAQRMDDRLQNHIAKQLTDVSEEDVQHTVPNLIQAVRKAFKKRITELQKLIHVWTDTEIYFIRTHLCLMWPCGLDTKRNVILNFARKTTVAKGALNHRS